MSKWWFSSLRINWCWFISSFVLFNPVRLTQPPSRNVLLGCNITMYPNIYIHYIYIYIYIHRANLNDDNLKESQFSGNLLLWREYCFRLTCVGWRQHVGQGTSHVQTYSDIRLFYVDQEVEDEDSDVLTRLPLRRQQWRRLPPRRPLPRRQRKKQQRRRQQRCRRNSSGDE